MSKHKRLTDAYRRTLPEFDHQVAQEFRFDWKTVKELNKRYQQK